MPKYFILIFIFFISCSNSENAVVENIQLYHKFVNQAEDFIVCEKYNDAVNTYKEAFHYKKNPFAIDIYNRMHCAAKIKNEDLMYQDAKSLVTNKGVSFDLFEKRFYSILRKNKEKWEAFKNWHPKGREQFISKADTEASKLFRELDYLDQKFRAQDPTYTVLADTIKKVDQAIMKQFRAFIDENGYPTQEMIGVRETVGNEPGFSDFSHLILIHYYGNFNDFDFDLTPQLLNEVKKGAMEPDYMEQFVHTKKRFSSKSKDLKQLTSQPISIINGNYYIAKMDSMETAKEDSIRAEMFLESNASLHNKAFKSIDFFQPFAFKPTGLTVEFNLSYPEQEEIMVNLHELVKFDPKNVDIHCN